MPLLSVFVLSSNTGGERRLHSELTVAQLKVGKTVEGRLSFT
jgi:hypothetical protein